LGDNEDMEAPTRTAAGRPDVRYVVRTRRRFPRKTFVLLAVLALLMGKGFGWIGGGDPQPGKENPPSKEPPTVASTVREVEPQQPAESPAKATGRDLAVHELAVLAAGQQPMSGGPSVAPTVAHTQNQAEGDPQGTPPVGGSGQLSGAAVAMEPPSTPVGETRPAGILAVAVVDPDRFGSLVSLLRTSTVDRRFGSAMFTLQRLRDLPLDAAQQTALVQPAADLESALGGACGEIVKSVCEGQVLEATFAIESLLHDDQGLVLPMLVQSLALCGVRGELQAVPVPAGAPWPQPKALAKGRAVRARIENQVVTGRVIDSRADRVTLRVQRDHSVTFPTVPTSLCEPIDATPAEAVEMAFAALHAGKVAMARLWLGCASMRAGEAPEATRHERLQQLLR
jgi:hypothetical protein